MLTNQEKEFALKLIEKIYTKNISVPFQKPVDPVRDNVIDYYDIIKEPICLDEVKKKLEDGKYTSLTEWEKDVMLIWTNAITFNSRQSIIYLMAVDLQRWFLKKLAKANGKEKPKWKPELIKSTYKMLSAFSNI